MPHLPPELISDIIERIYYNASGDPDEPTLKACSFVSRAWAEQSQRLLFRQVNLRRNVNSFIRAIDATTTSDSRLGTFIRILDVTVCDEIMDTGVRISDFITILSYCPRLYQLILRISGIHEFTRETLSALQRPSAHNPGLSTIKTFSLMHCGIQSPILYQLLDVWPTIQFLRVGIELNADPPNRPAHFRLYELALNRIPSLEIMRWLLSASETSLEIVELRDIPGASHAGLLAAHGAHIRSLRLVRYETRAAAVIGLCTSLEELVIFDLSSFMSLVPLPQTLEHLSFDVFRRKEASYRALRTTWSPNQHLVSVVGLIDALPRLRTITCDASHIDFPALRTKCEERDIELRARTRPVWALDDAVPARRFLRGKSLANFPLMN